MRQFWIYKCNSKGHEYQSDSGDWAEVFATTRARSWGTTEIVPELAQAHVGDTVLAYQTDRTELVGIARVVAWKPRGKNKDLIIKPIRAIGVRVRPLKLSNAQVARIPALQSGPIRTLYKISAGDVAALIKATDMRFRVTTNESENAVERSLQGAGFGTPEQNKLVEKAAVRHVIRHYRNRAWSAREVSRENRGYDLLCKEGREELHVEVKGARGEGQQFVLTAARGKKFKDG